MTDYENYEISGDEELSYLEEIFERAELNELQYSDIDYLNMYASEIPDKMPDDYIDEKIDENITVRYSVDGSDCEYRTVIPVLEMHRCCCCDKISVSRQNAVVFTPFNPERQEKTDSRIYEDEIRYKHMDKVNRVKEELKDYSNKEKFSYVRLSSKCKWCKKTNRWSSNEDIDFSPVGLRASDAWYLIIGIILFICTFSLSRFFLEMFSDLIIVEVSFALALIILMFIVSLTREGGLRGIFSRKKGEEYPITDYYPHIIFEEDVKGSEIY